MLEELPDRKKEHIQSLSDDKLMEAIRTQLSDSRKEAMYIIDGPGHSSADWRSERIQENLAIIYEMLNEVRRRAEEVDQ